MPAMFAWHWKRNCKDRMERREYVSHCSAAFVRIVYRIPSTQPDANNHTPNTGPAE